MSGKARVASGELRVSETKLAGARHAHFGTRNSQLATRNLPRGLTLVELLITMVIIAIISAAVLGTASAAMETARRSRTQTIILRIHTLLMERWADYETRRVDVNPVIASAINLATINDTKMRGWMMADARLLALRELMKLEMPDRWSDILNNALIDSQPLDTVPADPQMLAARPALSDTYYRQFLSLTTDDVDTIRSNQGAECLYLIIMFATGDGEARTMFADQDIGDTDGDGASEFLDGWGRPIQFIRWPAGFVPESSLMTGDGLNDHDPFDLFRRDAPTVTKPPATSYPGNMREHMEAIRVRNNLAASNPSVPPYLEAFRLVPLIYSIGADEDSDITIHVEAATELDPYDATYGEDGKRQLGEPHEPTDQESDGEGWHDNIHNHSSTY